MKKKLTKIAAWKFEMMRAFLNTEIGKRDGIMVGDNDVLNLSVIKKIWSHAMGIALIGSDWMYKKARDFCYHDQVNQIFTACRRGDKDFVIFLNAQEGI
jgi:hypothetical protein